MSGNGVNLELVTKSELPHLLADQPTCRTYMRLKLLRPCPSVHVSRDPAAGVCQIVVGLP